MPSSGVRREVPDSEDEPLTSSPINTSDGAADKLYATARVPVQDTQDTLNAPKEATHSHQAIAENVANVPGERTDGLDADRNIASVDLDLLNNDKVGLQSSPTISSAEPSSGADSNTKPMISGSSVQPKLCTVDKAEQTIAASNISSSSQDDTNCETMKQPADSLPDHKNKIGSEKEFHSAQTGTSQEASNASVSSWDEHTPYRENTSRIQEGTPIERPDNTGDGNAHNVLEHEDLHAKTQGSAGYKDVKPAVLSLNLAITSSTDFQSQQPPDSTSNIPGTNGGLDRSTDISSTSHYSTIDTDQGSAKSKTGITGTAMNVDTSYPTSQTESQTSTKDSISILSFSTNPTSSAPTVETNSAQETNMAFTSTFNTTSPRTSNQGAEPTMNSSAADAESSSTPQPASSSQLSSAPTLPTPSKTPQEITLAELKAQKSAMLASLATLPAIQVLMEENASANAKTSDSEDEPTEADIMVAANKIVKDHIKLLHEYNELKDVGQGLMGLIADQRGVRIVEVQEEFGIEAND